MRALVAFVTLWMVLSSWTAPAVGQDRRAKLELCNRSLDTLTIAIVEWSPVPLRPEWSAHGWYNIAVGGCARWENTSFYDGADWNVFLSVIKVGEDGDLMFRDYGVVPIPALHLSSKSYRIERFFCIEENAFRVSSDTINAVTCDAGQFQQLFNLYVRVKSNTLFTLDLT